MGADNVLEWEVVDGTGELRTASPAQNSDLYWALTGGGGGTYGLVVSVTVKLHPDVVVTGVQLRFDLDPGNPLAFHGAVAKYHQLVPQITSGPHHGMGIAAVTNTSFSLSPLTLPNGSPGAARALLGPLLAQLDTEQVPYDLNITQFPHWLAYWDAFIKPNPTQLVQNGQYGGWMVPRRVLDGRGPALQAAIQDVTGVGCTFVSLALNVSTPARPGGPAGPDAHLRRGGRRAQNAVAPAWREAALNIILST